MRATWQEPHAALPLTVCSAPSRSSVLSRQPTSRPRLRGACREEGQHANRPLERSLKLPGPRWEWPLHYTLTGSRNALRSPETGGTRGNPVRGLLTENPCFSAS